PYGAEALTAHVLAAAVEAAAAACGGMPGGVVLVHPDGLDPYRTGLLAEAARLAGIPPIATALIAHHDAVSAAGTSGHGPAAGAAAHGWQRWPAADDGAATVAVVAGGAGTGAAALAALATSGGAADAAVFAGGPQGTPLTPAAGPTGTPLTPTAGPTGTPLTPTAGPTGTPLTPGGGPGSQATGRTLVKPRKPWVKVAVGGAAAAAAVATTVVIVLGDDAPATPVTVERDVATTTPKAPDNTDGADTGGTSTTGAGGDRFDVSGLLGTYLGPCEPYLSDDGASQGSWTFEDTGVDQVTMTADGFEFVTADCTGDRTNVVTMPWVFTIVGVTEVEGIPAWQIIDQAGEKGVVAVTPDGTMRFGSPGSPAGADGFPIQLDPIEQAAQRVTTA
ncbi:MAG: hypothetical protein KDB06_05475, partial [Ilumatobacter sp.]|nr:hypothetical protein [Ilumatobacter sp.]